MGEHVQVAQVAYTVLETQWAQQLGEGLDARIPQHRFLLLRLSALNTGNSDANPPAMTLVGDDGKTYEEVQNGDKVPQWVGYLRRIRPSETLQGNVLFDAPPAHYLLKITEEDGERFVQVDIPLTFSTGPVALPTPTPTPEPIQ